MQMTYPFLVIGSFLLIATVLFYARRWRLAQEIGSIGGSKGKAWDLLIESGYRPVSAGKSLRVVVSTGDQVRTLKTRVDGVVAKGFRYYIFIARSRARGKSVLTSTMRWRLFRAAAAARANGALLVDPSRYAIHNLEFALPDRVWYRSRDLILSVVTAMLLIALVWIAWDR